MSVFTAAWGSYTRWPSSTISRRHNRRRHTRSNELPDSRPLSLYALVHCVRSHRSKQEYSLKYTKSNHKLFCGFPVLLDSHELKPVAPHQMWRIRATISNCCIWAENG